MNSTNGVTSNTMRQGFTIDPAWNVIG